MKSEQIASWLYFACCISLVLRLPLLADFVVQSLLVVLLCHLVFIEVKVNSEVKVNRGISQGDSVPSILFVITWIPLSILLRDMKAEYMSGEARGKINNLLFMDVLELFGKMMQEIDSDGSSKNFQ